MPKRTAQKTEPLRLIVGLGNPGSRYRDTRHNVGAAWVERLAADHDIRLREEAKFKGTIGRGEVLEQDVFLLVPSTYMNNSGESVAAVLNFYKFAPLELLVAHDELAFAPGVARLKTGGGTNGHNGLRDIIPRLGNRDGFHRLRIGVGHPGSADRVAAYLTSVTPPAKEREAIERSLAIDTKVLGAMLRGDMGRAMNALHATDKPSRKRRDPDAESSAQAVAAEPKRDPAAESVDQTPKPDSRDT